MSVINLENITKSYGHHMIFKDYNLSVEEGEFVAICGESGKGKTTLLNIMGMIEKADKGDLYLFDRKNPDIRKASGRKLLRTEMTYVFQNYGLVEDKTVQYNLNIASHFTDVTEKDIEDVLNKVGLDKSILKNKVYTLSGGEQQRVAIARVFLRLTSSRSLKKLIIAAIISMGYSSGSGSPSIVWVTYRYGCTPVFS